MHDDLLPVHLGDVEVVDGVLVREPSLVTAQVAMVAGAAVLVAAAIVSAWAQRA